MSVKELRLVGLGPNITTIKYIDDELHINIWNETLRKGMPVVLDRNQADMLRLYLTEHLK